MAALFVTVALGLNTTAIAQAPSGSLWYNGDFNGVNGLSNERNTLVTQAAVYDDFNVTDPLWHVAAVFSDNLANTVITGADWEIRTGLSEGNSGALIASGTTSSPLVIPTGRNVGNELTEYMVEVTGLNVSLPILPSGQHYWLNVTPIGPGAGASFNSTTSGVNCVGTPCGNNANNLFNSTYFGVFFGSIFNEQPQDYSMGVIGTVVPEPGNGSAAHLRRGSTAGRIALPAAQRVKTYSPRLNGRGCFVWVAHAPSRAGDDALVIADFAFPGNIVQLPVHKFVSARRRNQHARARALPRNTSSLVRVR